MGKLTKTTLVRKSSQVPKLKSTGYSIIFGRNLIKKGGKKWQRNIIIILKKQLIDSLKN